MVVAVSMMTGARPILAADSNDIDSYYYVYQMLADGDLNYLTHFGGGIDADSVGLEVGLPLFFYFLVLIFPPISVNGLMFFLALASSFLLFLWVEKIFYSGDQPRHPALLGASILMLNLYFSTQLSRQFISLIILLYAFTSHGWLKQWLFVGLAAAFHLTAIPFYVLYRLLRWGPVGWGGVAVMMVMLGLFFERIFDMYEILPSVVVGKLLYYVGNSDEFSIADLSSLRMIFLLCCLSFLVLIVTRFKPAQTTKTWLATPWIAAVIHIALLPIPLASLRATLLIHSIVPGLLAYKMLDGGERGVRKLSVIILNFLIFYKISGYILADDSGNLLSSIKMMAIFLP